MLDDYVRHALQVRRVAQVNHMGDAVVKAPRRKLLVDDNMGVPRLRRGSESLVALGLLISKLNPTGLPVFSVA